MNYSSNFIKELHIKSQKSNTNLEVISLKIDKKNSRREDTTKYGEFVCSEYQWLPIEKQKEQAKEMANMTKKEKGKKIKKV